LLIDKTEKRKLDGAKIHSSKIESSLSL